MLTFLVFFPLVGALVIATLPREQERQAKYMALFVTALVFVVSLVALGRFDRNAPGFQIRCPCCGLQSAVPFPLARCSDSPCSLPRADER